MTDTIAKTPLQRFFSMLKVDRQEILSIYVYALFNGIVSLSLPLGIQAIINLLTGGQISTSWIVLVVIVIAGVAFTGVMQIMQLTITENLQQKIFTRSAFEFAYRIPRLKTEAVDQYYIPEMVNRFFDTLSVQKGLSKILMDFSSSSLQILFGLILLSLYHPFFILFSVALLIIVYLIFRFTAPSGLRTSIQESKYKYEVAHWLEEMARVMETFKLAGSSELPLQRTDEVVTSYLKSRKQHFKTLVVQFINLVGFKVFIAAGLLLIGGLLVINQQMNIGQFVAAEIIIILILNSVEKLILSMETIYDVLTALEKIGNVTDLPLESNEGSKLEEITTDALSINLHDLNYRFQDSKENVLKGISLEVKEGEKVVIAGQSGSGKSLILQMLAGLYSEFDGAISYNRIPLGNWCKEDLRSIIGDSLAKEDVFKGSLYENITLGVPGVDINNVREAIEVVGLTEYVESLPQGLRTQMRPEGQNLPKSIRLKIMLARSLARDPKLVLVEDAINELDPADMARLINHLKKIKATVIIVSNNPLLVQQFDKVAILQKGELLIEGSYDEVKDSPEFKTIIQN